MTVADDLVENARRYAASFDKGSLPIPPAMKLVVLACMDARLNLFALLGLSEGDAQLLRNAGGVVTDDVVRSLAISQRLLGTEEIMLIHHSDCGMLKFRDDELKDQIAAETGIRPPFAMEAFPNLEENVRQSIARIIASPFIPRKDKISGFIYEVETGQLRRVRSETSDRVP